MFQGLFLAPPNGALIDAPFGPLGGLDGAEQLGSRRRHEGLARGLSDVASDGPEAVRIELARDVIEQEDGVNAARIADEQNARIGRPRQYQKGGWIQYVVTQNGPEPLETRHSRIDYEHYLTRQLQPIADAILQPIGESFMALTTSQRGLF